MAVSLRPKPVLRGRNAKKFLERKKYNEQNLEKIIEAKTNNFEEKADARTKSYSFTNSY